MSVLVISVKNLIHQAVFSFILKYLGNYNHIILIMLFLLFIIADKAGVVYSMSLGNQ